VSGGQGAAPLLPIVFTAGVGVVSVVFAASVADLVVAGWGWWRPSPAGRVDTAVPVVGACTVAGYVLAVLGSGLDRWLSGAGAPSPPSVFWPLTGVGFAMLLVVPVMARMRGLTSPATAAPDGSDEDATARSPGHCALSAGLLALAGVAAVEMSGGAVLGTGVLDLPARLASWQASCAGRVAAIVGGTPVVVALIAAAEAWLSRSHRRQPCGNRHDVVPPALAASNGHHLRPLLQHSRMLGLAQLFAELTEVAVWTAGEDDLGEHSAFLLRIGDGTWHVVGFAEARANELVERLHALPGFDPARLMNLITGRERGITGLWPPVRSELSRSRGQLSSSQ